MTSDQFTKLFVHMEKRFTSVESTLEGKADRSQLDRIFLTLDALVKQSETGSQEQAAIMSQLDRFGTRLDDLEAKLDAAL